MISVHRGLWGPAPENSLSAIAAASGFDIIEIDTQIARGGVPMVVHDASLSRTTGSPLILGNTDHVTLGGLRLREGAGGQGAKLTDENLPTLAQALEAAGPNAYFDIDVKFPAEIEAVATAIKGANKQHMGSLKIYTETPKDIEQLLALQKQFGIMVMAKVDLAEAGLDHIRDLTEAGVAAAEVRFYDLTNLKEVCDIAAKNMAISTYTLDPVHCCGLNDTRAKSDPAGVWGLLLDAGVNVIMTDLAPTLDDYLRERWLT